MANDVVFEGKERRMPKIEKCLADNGIESLEVQETSVFQRA